MKLKKIYEVSLPSFDTKTPKKNQQEIDNNVLIVKYYYEYIFIKIKTTKILKILPKKIITNNIT